MSAKNAAQFQTIKRWPVGSYDDELKEYESPDGLVTPLNQSAGAESVDSTGNGLSYRALAERVRIFEIYKTQSLDIRDTAREMAYDAYTDVLASCTVLNESGGPFFRRSPTKLDEQTAKDDYVHTLAALEAYKKCGVISALRWQWSILNAGNVRQYIFFKWFYPNIKTGKISIFAMTISDIWRAWFGKSPEVVTSFQLAYDISPNILRVLWTAAHFRICSLSDHSGIVLHDSMIFIMHGKNKIIDAAIHKYVQRLEAHWGQPYYYVIKSALAEELSPTHPVVTHWV